MATLHAWMVGQGREEGGGAATLLFVCGSANKVASGIYVGSVECGEVQRSFAIGRPINDVARFSRFLPLGIKPVCPCDRMCRPIVYDAH